jgi:hypothetical protein
VTVVIGNAGRLDNLLEPRIDLEYLHPGSDRVAPFGSETMILDL